MSDYWHICIEEALSEAGVMVTEDQLNSIAEDVRMGHEMYGESHGYHLFSNPMADEIKTLKSQLEREENKVVCPDCKGIGVTVLSMGTLVSRSSCFRCSGSGKVDPGK